MSAHPNPNPVAPSAPSMSAMSADSFEVLPVAPGQTSLAHPPAFNPEVVPLAKQQSALLTRAALQDSHVCCDHDRKPASSTGSVNHSETAIVVKARPVAEPACCDSSDSAAAICECVGQCCCAFGSNFGNSFCLSDLSHNGHGNGCGDSCRNANGDAAAAMCLCLCALIFIAVVAVPPVFSLIRLWNSNLRTSVKIAGTAGILGAVGGGLVALHESSEFNWGKRECVDQAQKDCGYPEKWLIVLPMAIWAVFLGVELSRSMVFSQPCGSRNGERTTCLQRTAPCLYNNQPLFWCDLHQSSTAESSTTDRLLEEDNEHSDSPHSSH